MIKAENIQNYSIAQSSGLSGNFTQQFIIQKEPDQQKLRNESCSKHSQKKGEYFESQHPWIKFCESCALNIAICGKRIEKSMTSDQMFTKITLCNTLDSICLMIKQSQSSHEELSSISIQLQQTRQKFIALISEIDVLVDSLITIKNQLENQVQTSYTKEIKNIFERQSLIVSKKVELINQKTRIECGFLDMIAKGHQEENTVNIIGKCRTLIQEAQQMFATEEYKSDLAAVTQKVERIFQEKLYEISQAKLNQANILKINSESENQSAYLRAKTLRTQYKTGQTLADQSTIQESGVKVQQTYSSTLQSSSLVTPIERQQLPLQEITPTKRNTRATLQLKARCKSKSGHKKIEVNVREDKQRRLSKQAL